MLESPIASLPEHFSTLEDPRADEGSFWVTFSHESTNLSW
jgi:hypothetical protein